MPQSIPAFADTVRENEGKFLGLFDFDGTVVDSEHISARAAWGMFRDIGYSRPLADYVATVVGKTRPEIMDTLERELGTTLTPAFKDTYARTIFETYIATVEPMAHVEAALRACPATALASNSARDKINGWIDTRGFTRQFPPGRRFYADMVARGKPAPDLFLLAAETLGVAPACCVVVGDSPADMQAANAAGMLGLGFVAGGHVTDRAAHAVKLIAAGAAETFDDMRHLAARLQQFAPEAIHANKPVPRSGPGPT